MSNAEHLIENAIFAIKEGRDLDEELDRSINKMMLDDTGMSKEDVIGMANHVVYSLYDGRFPDVYDAEELSHYGRTWIPDTCRNCSNHPSNGGSGICNCILGGIQWV